jgi:prevent-host-death family protein
MPREESVTDARKKLADLVNQVVYRGERIVLTRHGKVVAAIVSAEDFELLSRLLSERIDVTEAGQPGQPAAPAPGHGQPGEAMPLRIAAEYRPGGNPRPPGFRP